MSKPTSFRSLDVLIHEEVIGSNPLLDYSSDISAAWTVVESMCERGWQVYIDSERENGWRVVIYSKPRKDIAPCYWDGFEIASVTAVTAPLAICLAALEAIENE